jgi:hypothetical protein
MFTRFRETARRFFAQILPWFWVGRGEKGQWRPKSEKKSLRKINLLSSVFRTAQGWYEILWSTCETDQDIDKTCLYLAAGRFKGAIRYIPEN